jgi:hypothetical protein
MGFGNFRPVLVSVFAVLFGLAQLLCACMSVQAAPMNHSVTHVAEHPQAEFGLFHAVMGAEESQATSEHTNGHQNHDGDHAEGCTHCDGYSAVTPIADNILTVSAELPSLDKVIITTSLHRPKTRADMSPSAMAGLRWLDPPRDTLVSLLIRLQR